MPIYTPDCRLNGAPPERSGLAGPVVVTRPSIEIFPVQRPQLPGSPTPNGAEPLTTRRGRPRGPIQWWAPAVANHLLEWESGDRERSSVTRDPAKRPSGEIRSGADIDIDSDVTLNAPRMVGGGSIARRA
jgi:hypothetical protein